MSDIFISYASKDRQTAKALAEILGAEGWSVWWDRKIPTGKRFAQIIEEELSAAKCVIVLWSKASVQSDWVIDEADEGRSRDILLPALIEDIKPPYGFRRLQSARLVDWNGKTSSPELQKLTADIAGMLGPVEMAAKAEPGKNADTKKEKSKEKLRTHQKRSTAPAATTPYPTNGQITEFIISYLKGEVRKQHGIDISNDKLAMKRISEAALKAQKELSSSAQAEVNLPFLTADDSGPKHLSIKLTKRGLRQSLAIVGCVIQEVQKQHGIDVSDDRLAMERIVEAAFRAQKELSSSGRTELNLPFLTADVSGPKHYYLKLSQSRLSGLVSSLGWP